MNQSLPHLHEAMRLMQSGDLVAATAIIQRGLGQPEAMHYVRSARAERDITPASETFATPGEFNEHAFASPQGARKYKLFVPLRDGIEPRPLLVLLHGCTQDPDDFARGTRMNAIAQEHDCYVAYPAQPQSANASRCWNWFRGGDQARGTGEPAIIAGLVTHLATTHPIDTSRIYVAGMSAGGAMAVILGATYPELFAAVGVHSGLPYGAARDLPSALAAMRSATPVAGTGGPSIPTIVFHGDADTTVHPCNGERVVADSLARAGSIAQAGEVTRGASPGGREFTRTQLRGSNGRVDSEHWLVHGAGHTWSGGDAAGSHTDPKGPDASREMLRFFLERARD